MKRLLLLHHQPSDQMRLLVRAAAAGAVQPELSSEVTVCAMPALSADPRQIVQADGVLIVTPVNFGALAGATKHAFDKAYRALEPGTAGRPWGAVIKGSTDTTGAVRQLEAIITGLRWRQVAPILTIEGTVSETHLEATTELAATLAAALALG